MIHKKLSPLQVERQPQLNTSINPNIIRTINELTHANSNSNLNTGLTTSSDADMNPNITHTVRRSSISIDPQSVLNSSGNNVKNDSPNNGNSIRGNSNISFFKRICGDD